MRTSIGIAAAAVCALLLAGCGGGGGDNKGILSFTSLSYGVNENGNALNIITVQRLGGDGEVSCTVLTESGTASSGTDFVPETILLTWPAGDLSNKTMSISIIDDHDDEPEETVTLRLVNPTGGATIRDPLGDTTLHIQDDDVAGTIQFSTPSYVYLESGVAFGSEVTVTRSGGQDGVVTATLVMHDGTANSDPNSQVEPVDYMPFTLLVTFADQDTTPVPVSLAGVIRQDLLPEPAESFTLELIDPTGGATIGFSSPADVAIGDDDFVLEIPNPEPGMLFGATVVKLGSKLLIGAPGNAAPSGRVYVFDPADGSLVDTISRPFSSQLGSALAVGANALAIGSPGSVWVLDPATLMDRFAPLTSALLGFGVTAIVLGDGRLVVGAPQAPASGGVTPAGAARVFDELTGAPLQSIDGVGDSMLGAALARFGTDLLVGAPGGAGSLLQYSGDPFVLGPVFANPMPQVPSAGFARALATIDADSAIYVGVPDADVAALVDAGRVDLITPSAGATAASSVAGARFGTSLLPSQDFLFIGAPGEGAAGAVHVWDELLQFELFPIDSPNPTAGSAFGSASCDFDGSIVITAPHQLVGGVDRGSVFIVKLF